MDMRCVLIVLLVFLGLGPVSAQHFLSVDGQNIVNEAGEPVLLRGMGLGGWMVQEGYMMQTSGFAGPQYEIRAMIEDLIGVENTDAWYDAWLHNHVQKSDIDSLKAWGFNSVRLPMHYNLWTLPIEDEPVAGENTWIDTGFELTDSLVAWCAANEMYVILDLHAAPGGQGYAQEISDYNPAKPSLWESIDNKNKMVALWKRIAEHYVGEQWVAGYDLLNEPNWNLPNGSALRSLYMQCTDSIRTVDPDHIIFIEGNWFANDFTGLTPPWDDQLVYSPHKYWSKNEPVDMEFVTSLRNEHNVPLYVGESGENGNAWFRDAIHLLEDLNMGWAWWPLKKIESISCPMSIAKTDGYQDLLDYWNGNALQPSVEVATASLMELAEGLKTENCVIQTNVPDAMFRQVATDETKPFHGEPHPVPGLVYATDFDLGRQGYAYNDEQVATFHVTTGEFTAWNNGWQYRNDGVDIEFSTDQLNSNGYNVGWISMDEWMDYTVDVATSGLYDIDVRVAADGSNGIFHLNVDGVQVTSSINVQTTGGASNWSTLTIEDVLLMEGVQTVRFQADQSGFNVGSFDFTFTGIPADEVDMAYLTARTLNANQIALTLNKPISQPLNAQVSDFQIFDSGVPLAFNALNMSAENDQTIVFDMDELLLATQDLTISYTGSGITAVDGSSLQQFTQEPVDNTLDFVYPIPGWIEVENFVEAEGVEIESTTDVGGGLNVGYLDPGDYMLYDVNVLYSGDYDVSFRTASQSAGGVELVLLHDSGINTYVCEAEFPSTGGWQTWQTTTETVTLNASGEYQLRVLVTAAPFNLNWIEFKYLGDIDDDTAFEFPYQTVVAYPNPTVNEVNIAFGLFFRQDLTLSIYDNRGRPVYGKVFRDVSTIQERIDVSDWAAGLYNVFILREDETVDVGRFIKIPE